MLEALSKWPFSRTCQSPDPKDSTASAIWNPCESSTSTTCHPLPSTARRRPAIAALSSSSILPFPKVSHSTTQREVQPQSQRGKSHSAASMTPAPGEPPEKRHMTCCDFATSQLKLLQVVLNFGAFHDEVTHAASSNHDEILGLRNSRPSGSQA